MLTASCAVEEADPTYTVGLVTNNTNGLRNVAGFIEGLAELGYVEGDNIDYVYAGEPLRGEALDLALADMVATPVDLIFTAGTPTGIAAFEATAGTEIPVVFGVIADPIRAGVMEDLNAPGGNITGVKLDADQSRRLEYLVRIAPDSKRVLVPYNPDDAAATSAVAQVEAVAPDLGIELLLVEARTDADVGALLNGFPDAAEAIFMVPDSVVNARLAEIVAIAAQRKLPTSGPSIAQVEGGALTAYGFIHHDAGAQASLIADRILRGANPGTLPVENTESFLAINLDTATQIGLVIPEAILRQAEVLVRADDG